MRNKVEILQKQIRELMVMFYEDTGMLPKVEASSSLVELDGKQFVTKIDISIK
jgi:hypothetical protein